MIGPDKARNSPAAAKLAVEEGASHRDRQGGTLLFLLHIRRSQERRGNQSLQGC